MMVKTPLMVKPLVVLRAPVIINRAPTRVECTTHMYHLRHRQTQGHSQSRIFFMCADFGCIAWNAFDSSAATGLERPSSELNVSSIWIQLAITLTSCGAVSTIQNKSERTSGTKQCNQNVLLFLSKHTTRCNINIKNIFIQGFMYHVRVQVPNDLTLLQTSAPACRWSSQGSE
jgi:hypothetical protein